MLVRTKIFLVIFAVAASAAPVRDRKFDVAISPEDHSARIDRTDARIRVRITNRSKETLRTAGLGELNIYFSSCQPGNPSCDGSEFFYAVYPMPSKSLPENNSLEFNVPLSGIVWRRGPYNRQNSSPGIRLSEVPAEKLYLYADVKVLDGFEEVDETGKKTPRYREYLSNVLNAVIQ